MVDDQPNAKEIEAAWERATTSRDAKADPAVVRLDCYGAWIQREDFRKHLAKSQPETRAGLDYAWDVALDQGILVATNWQNRDGLVVIAHGLQNLRAVVVNED
jgi:hypothetical protein